MTFDGGLLTVCAASYSDNMVCEKNHVFSIAIKEFTYLCKNTELVVGRGTVCFMERARKKESIVLSFGKIESQQEHDSMSG